MSPQDKTFVRFLGETREKLTTALGEPFCEYNYNDKAVLMIEHSEGTLSCEINEGVVKSIDCFQDRRTAPRVKPNGPTKAVLRHGKNRTSATVIDMSIKSVALRIEDGELPSKGEHASFCTSLITRSRQRTNINLSGHIHRVDEKNRIVIVVLKRPFMTQSHQTLMDYINVRRGLMVLSGIATFHQPLSWERKAEEYSLVKSDLCTICTEPFCAHQDH